MRRSCDSCGKPYEAKRANSQYCSQTCGKRARRRGSPATVTKLPAVEPVATGPAGSDLVATLRAELEGAGRLDTTLGRQALRLGERMGSEFDTGSSLAALSKELRSVMDEAMRGAGPASRLDELKAKRAARRAG